MSNLVWFYCENCFKTEVKDMSKFQEAAESLTGFKWNKDGMFTNLSGLICPHCGCYHSTFRIDFHMIPVIRGLNENGYATSACCSGHNDSNCFHYESDEAYVLIDHSQTLSNYLDVVQPTGFGEAASFVNFEVEREGDSNICIRAKFKEDVPEEVKKSKGEGFLAIALFTVVMDFPENDDKLHYIHKKYSFCKDETGEPYLDEKGRYEKCTK